MRQKIRVHLETRARLAAEKRNGVPLDVLRIRYPRIRIRMPLGRDASGRFWRAP